MFEAFKLTIFIVFISEIRADYATGKIFDGSVCNSVSEFTNDLKNEIRSRSNDVQKIIDFIINESDKGVTYRELATFVDTFGPRYPGSRSLENSIDYLRNLLRNENHDKVYTEDVRLQKWTRGSEWAQMIYPRVRKISILGSGSSVGTNGRIITAPVMVVKSFDELWRRIDEISGKIVVYNFNHTLQLDFKIHPPNGTSLASQYGAVATLARPLTDLSIYSIHAGGLAIARQNTTGQIPAASITVEDAELLDRLTSNGKLVKLSLYIGSHNGLNVITRNLISELLGYEKPEQVVIVSGHLDSWDVGQGAVDDGGGAFISWRALSVLKKLGLKTKRTLRSVLWTAEESGLVGAQAYVQRHKNELNNISVVMESDSGTFTPLGLSYSGNNILSQCIVNEVLLLLKPINASRLAINSRQINSTDTAVFVRNGVPAVVLDTKNDKYYYFHHTNGDTMTAQNPDMLDLCTIVWTTTSYVFASLNYMLPR